jgi:ATP-dependent HslUV protease subunit HslV
MCSEEQFHGTTILAVRLRGTCALAGDGQVTLGQTVVKHHAKKIQRLHNGQVLAGFAGSTADAMALIHRFEARLEEYRGNLQRAAVELAKEWRTDRSLRRLEAFLVVADREATFLLSGAGDVIAPDDGIVAVGSGGPYALAAARALARHTSLDAAAVAREAMRLASEICIYTNEAIEVETLEG